MKQPGQVGARLKKAVKLKSANPRVYYDYRLMLEADKKYPEALSMFKTGLQLFPLYWDLNYALTLYYLQSQKKEQERKYGLVLRQYYSDNPDYQQVLRQLELQ
ncbi:MAG: hypothetical protein KGM98_03380 [Bacteroidota bacterium]|nr:hypothetical protein [Bacteroidota bacterium]